MAFGPDEIEIGAIYRCDHHWYRMPEEFRDYRSVMGTVRQVRYASGRNPRHLNHVAIWSALEWFASSVIERTH